MCFLQSHINEVFELKFTLFNLKDDKYLFLVFSSLKFLTNYFIELIVLISCFSIVNKIYSGIQAKNKKKKHKYNHCNIWLNYSQFC